jgi:hypothetical protein
MSRNLAVPTTRPLQSGTPSTRTLTGMTSMALLHQLLRPHPHLRFSPLLQSPRPASPLLKRLRRKLKPPTRRARSARAVATVMTRAMKTRPSASAKRRKRRLRRRPPRRTRRRARVILTATPTKRSISERWTSEKSDSAHRCCLYKRCTPKSVHVIVTTTLSLDTSFFKCSIPENGVRDHGHAGVFLAR